MNPTILLGNCMKVITGTFNLVFYMPPWNMPRRYNGQERGYPDDVDEIKYQQQQIIKLEEMSHWLRPNALLIYNHRNRIKNGEYTVPESWLLRLRKLTLWDTVTIFKGSTPNSNRGRGYPMREHLYCFRRSQDKSNHIYSNPKADEFSEKCWDSRSDTWYIPVSSTVRWHGSTHPAPAPLVLPYRVFKRWCSPGGSICDPTLGSGTSAIAAMMLNRKFTGAEIMRRYYLESLARIKAYQLTTKHKT